MSGFLFFLLAGLSVLVAAALIFVVIIQNSKGGGLSSSFGGASSASQILGARRSNEFIEKLNWYLAADLAIIVFIANVVGSSASTEVDPTLEMQRVLDYTSAYDETGPTELPTFETNPAPAPEENGGE